MRILKMYLIFVFILLTSLIFMARISTADTTGTIAGTVRAKQSGQQIVGVNVIVLETHWGAATDLNGKYRILSLPEGKYN